MKPNLQQIIKHDCVRLDEPSEARPGANAPRSRARGAKHVELLRVQGRVHAIELVCSCGETTLIELDYAEEKRD
jgi:hypothetical protein